MGGNLFSSDTVFTVTNLTSIIKELLENGLSDINLEGEISNFRPNSSGHIYFTLKDSNAQISAVMFRSRAATLTFRPKEGDKVKVFGSVSVYPPQGKYQINISRMEPAGEGRILALIEERKKKLAAEGIFDESRKKKIPFLSKTVGVVTSPTGAALRDILQITKRRNPNVNVIIFPSLVQGAGSEYSIASQIKAANDFNLCDVLIVGRGGGSLEDLLPFSEEIVCRAIAESHIPVISAVGHEIDWALSDFAADFRAPTPSAAAELAVPPKIDLLNEINGYKGDFMNAITEKIQKYRLLLRQFDTANMEARVKSIHATMQTRVDVAKENLILIMQQKIRDMKAQLEKHTRILEEANPQKILSRGYSMVRFSGTKQIITKQSDVKSGDKIDIFPAEGSFSAVVN